MSPIDPMTIPAPGPNPIRLGEAIRCFGSMVRNPDDTESGARFVHALQGRRNEENFQRFLADPRGLAMVREGRQLIDRIGDRVWLATLPAGSLGRAYLDFVSSEQISADGLREITMRVDPAYAQLDPARRLFADRVRDLHDLWHVTTGYSRDLVGESLLMVFSQVQLRTRAFPLLTRLAWLANVWRVPGYARLARQARRRAERAPWLVVQDWEGLLERPLAEVRESLRIGDPPHYQQIRSDGAPALSV